MRLCPAEITPFVEVTDAHARRCIKAGVLHGMFQRAARYFRRAVYSKQLRVKIRVLEFIVAANLFAVHLFGYDICDKGRERKDECCKEQHRLTRCVTTTKTSNFFIFFHYILHSRTRGNLCRDVTRNAKTRVMSHARLGRFCSTE